MLFCKFYNRLFINNEFSNFYIQYIIFNKLFFQIRHTQKSSVNKKPNVVFIMADDHAYQAISAYGSPLAKLAPTPNIDRIAQNGMLMNAAYCTNSICGPSRASILTGNYSHVNGFFKNEGGGDFNSDLQTFKDFSEK